MLVSLTHFRLTLRIVSFSDKLKEDGVMGLRKEELLLQSKLADFGVDLATVMCCPYKVVRELCVCMCAWFVCWHQHTAPEHMCD